jgi:hypothetical protein
MSVEFASAFIDGELMTVQRMFREGSAIAGETAFGKTALLLALQHSQLPLAQWLLEHGESSTTERAQYGASIWDLLCLSAIKPPIVGHCDAAILTSLLRFMVLREDPPASLTVTLSPEHVRVIEEGARPRAWLPAYLARRRALLAEHCQLIPLLRALVHD